MKIEIDASSSDDYGDYGTVRVYFDEATWLELQVADAHNLGDGWSEGGSLTCHHADGTEVRVWDGTLLSQWRAKRGQVVPSA